MFLKKNLVTQMLMNYIIKNDMNLHVTGSIPKVDMTLILFRKGMLYMLNLSMILIPSQMKFTMIPVPPSKNFIL